MIGWLRGLIIDREPPGRVVVDVNGVGYEVEISASNFVETESSLNPIGLLIHTIVREDAFLLYGFIHQNERALFKSLIKVNGVGPKLAMAILSSMTPDSFIQSIYAQDTAMLTRLPGVGKKTAERLLVEMKDRVLSLGGSGEVQTSVAPGLHPQGEAVRALEVLGYKHQAAMNAVKHVDTGQLSCETLIRLALQRLSK